MTTPVKVMTKLDYLPEYATEYSAGMDLRADFTNLSTEDNKIESITLLPGERMLVPTGLFIELPVGFEAQIRPRSGLALKHGITVLNTPGTIDADYRGEIGVILINLGSEPFVIKESDRIAQMVIARVARAELIKVDSLSDTERGEGGFGHTGVREIEWIDL